MRTAIASFAAGAAVFIVACTDDYDQFDFDGAGTTTAGAGASTSAGGDGPGGQPQVGGTGGQGMGAAGGVGATGGAPPSADVPCGSAPCAVGPANVCCIPDVGDPTCEATSDCDGGDTSVHCNGPEDCDAGQFCCGQLDGSFDYIELTCESDCGGGGEVVICDPSAPDPCPDAGDDCEQSGILPSGYAACQ